MKKEADKKYIRGNQDVDTSLLTLEMTWKGIRDERIKEQVGIRRPDSFLEVIKGNTINYYIVADEAKSFVDTCAAAVCNKERLRKSLKSNTIAITRTMQEYARELYPKIHHLSPHDFKDIITRVYYLQAECAFYGTAIAFSDIFGAITNRMLDIVKTRNNLRHSIHFYTSILGKPEEKSLTEIAYDEIRQQITIDEELLKKYFWLDGGYTGRGLTKEGLEKIRTENRQELSVDANRDELLHELKLTSSELKIFQASQDIIYTKSLRMDYRQFLYVILNRIVDRLSEQLNIPLYLIETLTTPELIRTIANKQNSSASLQDRWEHSIAIPTATNEYKIITGEEANSFVQSHLFTEDIKNIETIKGQVAQPGKVVGTVKLVFGPQHSNKVQEGDILVSTATSPQLLPAMKRAAAFLTDVGGITSHAAIVARELKKPCIVGTQIGTQVLQDGDEVEVDADKGIITKL